MKYNIAIDESINDDYSGRISYKIEKGKVKIIKVEIKQGNGKWTNALPILKKKARIMMIMTVKCNKCDKEFESNEKKTIHYCKECLEKIRKEQPKL